METKLSNPPPFLPYHARGPGSVPRSGRLRRLSPSLASRGYWCVIVSHVSPPSARWGEGVGGRPPSRTAAPPPLPRAFAAALLSLRSRLCLGWHPEPARANGLARPAGWPAARALIRPRLKPLPPPPPPSPRRRCSHRGAHRRRRRRPCRRPRRGGEAGPARLHGAPHRRSSQRSAQRGHQGDHAGAALRRGEEGAQDRPRPLQHRCRRPPQGRREEVRDDDLWPEGY